MAIIGIDLGTTNSLGAVYRNGKVELIPNRFGSFLTPSVVSVTEDGTILVGQVAKERLISHPESTVASFKKDMGTEKKWNLGGKIFLPEELSSFVIRSIIDDMEPALESASYDDKTGLMSVKTEEGRIFVAPEIKYRKEIHSALESLNLF